MSSTYLRNETAESMLAKTFFVVEATSFEQHTLWATHSSESLYPPSYPNRKPVKWEQLNPGWLVTVGKIGRRPCCISVSWARIDGQLVMFWYQCSQVSDSVKAETWIAANFKKRRSSEDANNFHNCIRAIHEANKVVA